MGLIFNSRYKRIAETSLQVIEQQKALISQMEIKVTEQNQLYRALYEFLSPSMALSKDSRMQDYIDQGYEGNPDVFAIVTKLASMFARLMDEARLMRKTGGRWEEVEDKEVDRLREQTNYYQSFFEFCRHWAVSHYITGNGIVYAPRLSAGLNKGKLTRDGMIIMPTQDVTIKSAGWRQPIGAYTLDLNQTYRIDPTDVWHERFAPTLNYAGGQNFMGMSPVKVAANIIAAQNAGDQMTAKMYQFGHPPGILSKEDEYATDTTEEQEAKFRERYRTKYTGVDNVAIPIFTLGKMNYTKIGYDNLREMDVINMAEHGLRVFCNILQVPSQLFNDTKGSTYNNQLQAEKAMYTNRLIPDVVQFCAGFDKILKAYGDYWLKPDYSEVECLQENKAEKVKWVSQMFVDGIITGDQYLEFMGEETTGLPEMQIRYTNVNRMPAGLAEDLGVDRGDKYYQDRNMEGRM